MTDDYDDYFDDGDCPNCGGEGHVFDCWDGFCENADIGCKLCTSRCDWCNPAKPNPALQKVLADALAGHFDPPRSAPATREGKDPQSATRAEQLKSPNPQDRTSGG